jgi:hypothetical protein
VTPLPLANSGCNLPCKGLSPSSQHTCWAHKMVSNRLRRLDTIFRSYLSFCTASFVCSAMDKQDPPSSNTKDKTRKQLCIISSNKTKNSLLFPSKKPGTLV